MFLGSAYEVDLFSLQCFLKVFPLKYVSLSVGVSCGKPSRICIGLEFTTISPSGVLQNVTANQVMYQSIHKSLKNW